MKRRLFRRGGLRCGDQRRLRDRSQPPMGFFAVASRPWAPCDSWAWLGPANDVTGAISTATMIPVVTTSIGS